MGPRKKVFKTNAVTTEFMRLLVILVSDQFDCTFIHICKRSLFLVHRQQFRIAAESDSPSEAFARPKWDTPFNWALNILKELPMDTQPSYGRVHGETTEERKETRRLTEENIDKKVEIVV